MKHLRLDQFCREKTVCGTTIGLTDGECEQVYVRLGGKRFKKRVPDERDSLDCLRYYCVLDDNTDASAF